MILQGIGDVDLTLNHEKGQAFVAKFDWSNMFGVLHTQDLAAAQECAQITTKCLIIQFLTASSPDQGCIYLYLAQRASNWPPNARTCSRATRQHQ